MKKFTALTILFTVALLVCLPFASAPKTANAETITGAKLEYFELNDPKCVWRDGEIVYIAEKELIVIYHNDTYKKVPLEGFSVESIAKCGNHLLILSSSCLYSLNLATFECALLDYPDNANVDFTNIASFAVNGNHFAVSNNDRRILIFEVTDSENFLFNLKYSDELAVDCSYQLALTEDLSIYYFSPTQKALYFLDNEAGMQGKYTQIQLDNVDCFAFDCTFYYKTNDVIYSLGKSLKNDKPVQVVDLTKLGITNSGDFFISGDKILICNTEGDAVLEYCVSDAKLTGFEVSFTKISLPEGFEIEFNQNPQFITVTAGTKLYDIHLKNSFTNGYFVFNGYHSQQKTNDYLVVSEVSNAYYLIAGDVVALVLKDDFTPQTIPQTTKNSIGYLTSNATLYLQPRLTKEFASFKVAKFDQVQVLYSITLSGVEYSLVSVNNSKAFIPSSFLVPSLKVLPTYHDFETATTINKSITVYTDKDLTTAKENLPARTQVIVLEKQGDIYKISYGEEIGYISASNLAKRGATTNKIVMVVIILAFSLLVTALFFEKKYLFIKKLNNLK